MGVFSKYGLLICSTLIILSFNITLPTHAAEEKGDITKLISRVKVLEGKLNSNAFSYDINLRAEVSASLTKQKMLLEQLKMYELRLMELESRTYANLKNDSSFDKADYIKSIKQLREEFQLLFSSNNDIQVKAIDSVKHTTNKAIENLKNSTARAIGSAEHFVYWLIYSFTAVFVLIGAYATWKGSKVVKDSSDAKHKVESLDTLVNSVSNKAREAESLYDGLDDKVSNNITELEVIKGDFMEMREELKTMHALMDFRENFSKYMGSKSKSKSTAHSIIKDGTRLLEEIKGLGESFDNKANISYITSVLGFLFNDLGEYKESYDNFLLSKETNVKGLLDRIHNVACLAAILYIESDRKNKDYLNVAKENYLQLSAYQDELEELIKDEDFKKILGEINE